MTIAEFFKEKLNIFNCFSTKELKHLLLKEIIKICRTLIQVQLQFKQITSLTLYSEVFGHLNTEIKI